MAPSRFASLPRYLMRDALTCHQGAINCNQLQSRYLMRDALRRIQRGTPRQRALKQRALRGSLGGHSEVRQVRRAVVAYSACNASSSVAAAERASTAPRSSAFSSKVSFWSSFSS